MKSHINHPADEALLYLLAELRFEATMRGDKEAEQFRLTPLFPLPAHQ